MNIQISENLKHLRITREVTQEELAEYLGVTAQSVSKWERGENYPDIMQLPAIAGFFDTTVDELLGMDAVRAEKRLQEAREKLLVTTPFNVYHREITELWRDLARDMPNNYGVQLEYADLLSQRSDEDDGAKKEAIKIAERVLTKCTDDWFRASAIRKIALLSAEIGDLDRANEYAEKVYDLNELMLKEHIADISYRRNAGTYDAERAEREFIRPHVIALQNYLLRVGDALKIIRNRRREMGTERDGDYFEMLKFGKYLDEIQHSSAVDRALDGLAEEKKYIGYNMALVDEYLRLGDVEKSLDCVEKIVDGWTKFDLTHTVNYVIYDTNDDGEAVTKLGEGTLGETRIREFDDAKFDAIRSEPRFIAAIERLRV
ncbi:MAG: helix-turn-helix domain-containing protein [Oscillospiraceae bacterium]|jgi:transcriptional regulator with XRE-family HTH domain|nr:helix-turn-helix domain-containing protein [Oscillospiraceae bacterium]